MKYKDLYLILILLFLASSVLAVSTQTKPSTQPTIRKAPIKCVSPTPKSWSRDDVILAFESAGKIGRMVNLSDPVDLWHAKGKSAESSKPYQDHRWQSVMLKQYDLEPFIQMDPYKNRRGKIPDLPSGVKSASFSDPVLRKAFIADAVWRTKLYEPRFLCLAMEINSYYEQNPGDFGYFVSLFKEARKAVKEISPETLVFVSFQYEQLLGKFGGQGDLRKHKPHWHLLEMFEPDQDAVGISTYPMESFVPTKFGPASALPDDYYRVLREHTKKPIIFTEVGWPSDSDFGGSPQSQAAFLKRFQVLIKDLNVPLVNWYFLYDLKGYGPVFESMGLFDSKGKPKPSYAVWSRLWALQ